MFSLKFFNGKVSSHSYLIALAALLHCFQAGLDISLFVSGLHDRVIDHDLELLRHLIPELNGLEEEWNYKQDCWIVIINACF